MRRVLIALLLAYSSTTVAATVPAATGTRVSMAARIVIDPGRRASITPHTSAPHTTSELSSAFVNQLNQMMPATPAEIQAIIERINATRAAIHPGPVPIAQSRTRLLNLEPGSALPEIKVAPGFVSSIVFLDSTGAPWPVTSVTVGNPKWFDVSAPKVQPQNLLTVAALGTHLSSNLAITLKDHATPIMIVLLTDQKTSAMLTALRANEAGPEARSPIMNAPVQVGANSVLLDFLDRVPPTGAVPLETDNPLVEAWNYQSALYVRTTLPAVFPAWTSTVSGEAGVRVYAMPMVSSLLLTRDGVPLHVGINVPAWTHALAQLHTHSGSIR